MAVQNKVPMGPVETLEWYARGCALDLLQMCDETGIDTVSVSVTAGNLPSVSWYGLRDGRTVFRACYFDDEVPREGGAE